MKNLPGIFRINRVNKAIVSLTERVASAQNIADSVPQIKTAVLNLQDEDGSQFAPAPAPASNSSSQQESALQLGAIFPNTITPLQEKRERLFLVVVDKGNPSKFYITNSDGGNLDWTITQKQMSDYRSHPDYERIKSLVDIIRESNKGSRVLLTSIEIPGGLRNDSSYRFVATQDSKEDRLMLTVSNCNFDLFITRS